MKLCVFGAGAVGGYLSARLIAAGGHEVSIVARGTHLDAIRQHGLTLVSGQRRYVGAPVFATDTPGELPPQDIVFVTLKSCSQPGGASEIARLIGPTGWAVFIANGIPWWWNHGCSPRGPLPLLDPHAQLWDEVKPERVLGCVAYSANEVVAAGVVRHSGNNRWIVGEPDARITERLLATTSLLRDAALQAEPSATLRQEIWTKVCRNLPFNSLCALTRLPIDGLDSVPGLRALADVLIDEVTNIAQAYGVDLCATAAAVRESFFAGGAPSGERWVGVKPSMLQDVIRGRDIEVEAIVGQVHQLGQAAAIPCPTIATVLGLLRGLASSTQPLASFT